MSDNLADRIAQAEKSRDEAWAAYREAIGVPPSEHQRERLERMALALEGAASEREKIAAAIEAQIRILRAVPTDVTTVPRVNEAMDLQNLADDVRRGRYAPAHPALRGATP